MGWEVDLGGDVGEDGNTMINSEGVHKNKFKKHKKGFHSNSDTLNNTAVSVSRS